MKKIDLIDAFQGRQRHLVAILELAMALPHPTSVGDEGENAWEAVLSEFLPARYRCERHAFVVDSDGSCSEQIDLVLYDPQYAPTLFVLGDHKYVPVESVYAVFEVKTTLDADGLDAAAAKAASVRALKPVVGQVGTIEGDRTTEAVPPLAGVMATSSSWTPPLGDPLRERLVAYEQDHKLDFGCILNGGSFRLSPNRLDVTGPDDAMISFCFELFRRLQARGTASPIDPDAYGAGLWG